MTKVHVHIYAGDENDNLLAEFDAEYADDYGDYKQFGFELDETLQPGVPLWVEIRVSE